MPAVRTKRKFHDDDFGDEFDACCSKSTKSMKILQSQASNLEQSAVLDSYYENPQDEIGLTTQLAQQDIRIMEAADFQDVCEEASIPLLKDSISEVATSLSDTAFLSYYEDCNYQLNLVNYVNEDGDGKSEAPDLIVVDNHEQNLDSSHSCSLFDIFLPEEAFPLLLNTSAGLLTDYTTLCDEFMPMDALLNINGRYGVVPSIEKTAGANIGYHEPAPSGGNLCFSNVEVLGWINQYFQEKDLPGLTDITELNPNTTCIPKAQEARKNVTLVLDLDETLVHSTLEQCDDADFTLPVFLDTKEHVVYVRKRPYLHMFLQKVAEMFEIVVFTAGQHAYADQLLDVLDPEKELFSKRFFRESCIFKDGSHTKDLTIVGVDLAKVAIIDNSPQVFELQVNNGIPIESWFNDPTDHALLQLIPFLETLAVADDVRPIIAERFGSKD